MDQTRRIGDQSEQATDVRRPDDSPAQEEEHRPSPAARARRREALEAAAAAVVKRLGNEAPSGAPVPLVDRIERALASASDSAVAEAKQLVGGGKQLAHEVAAVAMNAGGEAIGYAELAGLRYPVTTYEAQVSSELYRGSRVDDAGMAALKAQGIRAIVNLCLENNDDAPRAAKLGLAALHIPILDNSAPTQAQMLQFIAFVRANPPTYVHCEAGKGRTGTAVACYRIVVEGWTAERAIAEAKQFGLAMPNQIAFLEQFAADFAAGRLRG